MPPVKRKAPVKRRAPAKCAAGAKRAAPKRKPAAKASAHQTFMKAELARLKKKHNYVSGGKNKVEWSAIFSEACANWSKRR